MEAAYQRDNCLYIHKLQWFHGSHINKPMHMQFPQKLSTDHASPMPNSCPITINHKSVFLDNRHKLATCLHHVPLFKFIKQFQPFDPISKTLQIRIFQKINRSTLTFSEWEKKAALRNIVKVPVYIKESIISGTTIYSCL